MQVPSAAPALIVQQLGHAVDNRKTQVRVLVGAPFLDVAVAQTAERLTVAQGIRVQVSAVTPLAVG